jgi:REP element-mobilizing transposase RayT
VAVIVDSVLGAAQRHRIRVLAQAVLTEHVHVLVSFRPDCSLAAFVRDAKSESSRRSGEVTWCRGYYAGSVCQNHIATVRTYIANQYTRHPDRIPPE